MSDPQDRPGVSTPETMREHGGEADRSHGANTNLDPALQGGPATGEDQAATERVLDERERGGGSG